MYTSCILISYLATSCKLLVYLICFLYILYRDRPAAIPVHIRSIADTSNFDDFPEIEESHSFENDKNGEKDWVFQNYTFKRFEGLTQRGLLRMSNQ